MQVPTPAAAMAIRDSLEEEVLIALVRAAWLAAERSNAVTGAAGLSPSQYNVLRILRAARGTVLHGDRNTDGHARFRSHSPDVGSGSCRIRCARYRCRRSPSQHESNHCGGEGTAASSRWRRSRSREADPWACRSYSTHRAPRLAGRLRTAPVVMNSAHHQLSDLP